VNLIVRIIEPNEEWLEFEGKVIDVEKEWDETFCIDKFHIQIEPKDKG